MQEMESEAQAEAFYPKIAEFSIAIVDNGFVVRVSGRTIQKNYVVQAESDHPDEIEGALDLIRKIHRQTAGEG